MSNLDNFNRFSRNPVSLDKKRSIFKMPFDVTTTFNSGDLVPLGEPIEVLPGDTFSLDASAVIRSITPVAPVMDNSYFDIFAFFVPNRISTLHVNDWQKICGENFNGFWAPSTESTLSNTGNMASFSDLVDDDDTRNIYPSSVAGYMGLPIGEYDFSNTALMSEKFSVLPFNGYVKIWNEFFRDQNTQAPRTFNDAHSLAYTFSDENSCLKVNKFHDYFTSALPMPQKGESVLLPLGDIAPLTIVDNSTYAVGGLGRYIKFGINSQEASFRLPASGGNYSSTTGNELNRTNLYADLSNATASTVNQLRQAFAVQRLLERSARSGSRFREYLKASFGVSIPDATIQVPEYLGGKRVPLNINQVLQTSSTDSVSPLGSTGAFSNTSFGDKLFVKSFNEHGYVFLLGCVRTNQTYSQGLSRMWSRDRLYHWYDPIFASLGEQPVYAKELYVGQSSQAFDSTRVFGYQEAWADYRYKRNILSGYFITDGVLSKWTYAERYTSRPTLNSNFMVQSKNQLGQTLAVSNSKYQFFANFHFDLKASRVMPLFSIPGLIDHH